MHGKKPTPIEWVVKENGCWECTSHKTNGGGYPCKSSNGGKCVSVARFIYEECFGEIPPRLEMRHRCDNKLCINPEHLEIGTEIENRIDQLRNGTYGHKLNPEQIKEIRRMYISGKHNKKICNTRKLAKQYGVSTVMIAGIGNGRMWTNI